jgi:alkanesulfonate monooxygenase SsuD/methylene tetrahydromethanopterin reductase-like flavin-dependent oxidoreductase (luciferase family)
MRFGLYLPLFDGLADPALVAHLSAEAEEAGWDGVFVWDQLRWPEPVREVADVDDAFCGARLRRPTWPAVSCARPCR